MSLSPGDVSIVESTRSELRDEPLPPAMGQVGCLGAVAGVIVLVAWPQLLEAVPALSFFSPFAMLFAFVGIVGGPVMLMFGGQSGRQASRAAIEASLRVFEDPEAERDEQLRAATVLLTRAYISQGPSTDRMIDTDDAKGRIGDQIDVVLDVECYLAEQYGDWPVFLDGISDE